MSRLTVGLVGCGGISRAHARGYRALRDLVRVTAVCDPDRARAEERARDLEGAQIFTDYDEFLAHAGVDAVDLCLPHALHAPAAIQAAQAGKHILVEKPIATTLAEADAMIAAARAAGVTLMVAHNQRYDPLYQTVKRLLEEEALGPILCARADHNQDFQRPPGHWLRENRLAGGGVVIGSGIHRLDLLRWLVGEITAVASFQTYQPARLEGEVAAVLSLQFANGSVGEVVANWAVRRSPWGELLFLTGERGVLHNVGGLFLATPETNGAFQAVPVPPGDSFAEEIRHFVQCVTEGRTPLTDGLEGRRSLEVCLAAYRSARTGQVVRLPLAGDEPLEGGR